MSINEPEDAAKGGSPSATSRLVDLLLQALPAIGGAIGFVGFVAVIGGAIEWVRFSSAELPADHAVGVIPRAQLVTIGAVSMIAFTLLGLLAVLVALLIDRRGNASAPTWRGVVALSVAGLITSAAFADLGGWALAAVIAWIVVIGALSVRTLDPRALGWVLRWGWLRRLRDALEEVEDAQTAYRRAVDAFHGPQPPDGSHARLGLGHMAASELWVAIRTLERAIAQSTEEPDRDSNADEAFQFPSDILLRRADKARDAGEAALRKTASPAAGLRLKLRVARYSLLLTILAGALIAAAGLVGALVDGRWWLIPIGLLLAIPAYLRRVDLFAAALLVVGTAVLLAFEKTAWLTIMVLVVAVLAATILGVARVSRRFAWYGIAVFLAVPLFGATLSATRTARSPQLQPVALVRKSDDIGMCGVYIAQTGDRIYLGHIAVKPGSDKAIDGTGRVFWVPRDDVDIVTVGPLMSIKTVNDRALALLDEIYNDRAAELPARPPATQTTTETTGAGKKKTEVTQTVVPAGQSQRRPQPPKVDRDPEACNTIEVQP
jgi:hypothetical protein